MNFLKTYKIFLSISVIYLSAVFLISPWGNYAVGDDLYYLIQIKSFQNGNFIKNGYIDTAIILQIFIGYFWSYFFGLSFLSLKVLTIIFTIITIYILIKIFEQLGISNKLTFLGVLIIISNPKYFYLSLSFNSEIYFTFFMLLCVLFILKFHNTGNILLFVASSLFAGLSVMIRQHGILLILPLTYVLYTNYNLVFKKNIKYLIFAVVLFLTPAILGIFWPKQLTPYENNSFSTLGVIDFALFFDKFLNIWREIPYFSLLVIPFLGYLILRLNNKKIFLTFLFSLLFSLVLYQVNIFSIGNITYLEGFDAKTYFKISDSIFNNSLFKLSLSLVISLTFISLVLFFFDNYRLFIKTFESRILLLLSFLFLGSVLLADVTYERYFIYFEIWLFILVLFVFNTLKVKVLSLNYILTFLIFTITTLYLYDFHKDLNVKWDLAEKISALKNVSADKIYFNDNFSKYSYMVKKNNLLGLGPLMPVSSEFKCFIKTNVESKDNFFSFYSNKVEKLLDVYLKPEKFNNRYTRSNFKNCSNCQIILESKYYSPLYDLYGTSKTISSYCLFSL